MRVRVDAMLPIGSVVLLKEAERKLMIFGVQQISPEEEEVFDYIGVPYPEGSMGIETFFLFNYSDIDEVCFVGFSDVERQLFIERMQNILDEQNPSE